MVELKIQLNHHHRKKLNVRKRKIDEGGRRGITSRQEAHVELTTRGCPHYLNRCAGDF